MTPKKNAPNQFSLVRGVVYYVAGFNRTGRSCYGRA